VCPAEADAFVNKGSDHWNLETLFPVADMFAGLEDRREVVKIAIFDACRTSGNNPPARGSRGAKSGFSSIQIKNAKGNVGALETDLTFSETDLLTYHNLFRLTSCMQGQQSFEDDNIRHGIFFKCLLDGLDGEAVNSNGEVTIQNLANYVIEKTPPYAARVGRLKQEPKSSSNEFGTCVLTTSR